VAHLNRPKKLGIMSFWSAPLSVACRWPDYHSFLRSWVLSASLASRHYRLVLVTDAIFAQVARKLQLPFSLIDECLDEKLSKMNFLLWCSPKFVGVERHANSSFVHLDEDVYLWKPLPERLFKERVFGQNKEDLRFFFYRYAEFTVSLWVKPENWTIQSPYAVNAGVLGGCDVEFWQFFVRSYFDLVSQLRRLNPLHGSIPDSMACMAEQYYLAWLCQRHDVPIGFLFDENDGRDKITELGYTHLIGPAKNNPENLQRLESRVSADYPEFTERIDESVALLRKYFPNNPCSKV